MERANSEQCSRASSGDHASTSSGLSCSLADHAHMATLVGEKKWIYTFFCEARHDAQGEGGLEGVPELGIVSKWRQKERLKTTAVALVLCLNIGVDPPDVIKISPCARLECWVDPLSMQPPKALETIGKNLQAQYERWQPRAKYKTHLDPTMDDVKKLAISCRRTAKNERVLFHYNGHGVPRPTANGEIWVFNKSYTQYIPMSIYDLQAWVGSPAIYVFDCSAAGLIINSFRAFAEQRTQEAEALGTGYMGSPGSAGDDVMKEVILLAACGAGEVLPQSPDLPADVFTACLTTPIKVALRWFCSRSLLKAEGLTKELIDRIPGKQTDRKTPLGELNWIFTAITDSIAWNMLPRALFQRLFRQDLLVASLFRNFLLADRIMRAASCTPASYPRLPSTHQHPMWQAWDMAAEMCLLQLPALLSGEPDAQFLPSPFFAEQLTAFELWLAHGSSLKQPPEQLPIVLQVLLSQVHRLRALVLLGRFLDMGSWAVDLALSVGIFPYVLKLLQTTASDLRTTLILIWTKILALDKSCQADLVKDGGHHYFISSLDVAEPGMSADSRAQAAFVLAVICDGHRRGRSVCAEQGLLQKLLSLLSSMAGAATSQAVQGVSHASSPPLLVKWLCLCLGRLIDDQPELLSRLTGDALVLLSRLLHATHPEVRAAAVFALCVCIQVGKPEIAWNSGGGGVPVGAEERARVEREREIACYLLQAVYDASPVVRAEVAVGLARLADSHSVLFQDAVHDKMLNTSRVLKHNAARPAALQPAGASPLGAARSAPQETHEPRGHQMERLSSSHGASPTQAEQEKDTKAEADAMSARSTSVQGLVKKKSQANLNTLASPGVRRMSSDTFEASMKVGPASRSPTSPTVGQLAGSEAGSPQSTQSASNGTIYATADAARVGGGLYCHLLDAAITLATDPASVVAATGGQLLRVAGVELMETDLPPASLTTPLPASASPNRASSASFMRTSYSASGSSVGQPGEAASSGSGSSKWRSSWRLSASTGGRQLAASASTSPQSPPMQPQLIGACSRRQYTLKPVQANGLVTPDAASLASRVTAPARVSQDASSAASMASSSSMLTSGSTAQHAPLPPKPIQPQENGVSSARSPVQSAALPTSLVYRMSCEHFSRPLLVQQTPGHQGKLPFASGTASDSVFGTHDPLRTANRLQEREEKVQACAAVGRGAKLKEQVTTIDFGSRSVASLMHHPFRPILVGVDGRGTVKVYSHRHSTFVNSFHLADDKWPMSVVNMWQLNELQAGLLMVAAADGSVRVWRDYTYRGSQRLATAWQAVPLGASAANTEGGHCPSAYEWSEHLSDGTLLAVGGGAPSTVHLWNLQQELCMEQIPIEDRGPAALPKTVVKRIAVSRHHPLMVTTTSAGSVLLYDLRAPRAAAAHLKPHGSPMVGMAVEPGGLKDQLVTAAADGELKFIDFRVLGEGNTAGSGGESAFAMRPPSTSGNGSSGTLGVWKTVNASSNSRNLSALAAHPNAPLLATGTASQVVKLWSALGEQLCVIRATTSLLDSRRPGPVNTLAFHPYQLSLASGGGDTIVNLYSIKTGVVPDRAMSVPVR